MVIVLELKEESGSSELTFFKSQQICLMRCVLDRIIPPNGELPGAGELGLVGYIDQIIGRSTDLKQMFGNALSQIEIISNSCFMKDFERLIEEQQVEVLCQLEKHEPKVMEALVRYAYYGYYSNPRILDYVKVGSKPPQPTGYHVEPDDFTLLDKVKNRGRIYREI